jgi:uncharacterized cupin superfamily protein
VSGKDTGGHDVLVAPGGGLPPHRHDFEESFRVLEGEIELTFQGVTLTTGAGGTGNIPANAPHQFQNKSRNVARLLCLCAPAGQDEFFLEVGVRVATRTTPAPKLSESEQKAFMEKSSALAPKYRTELLRHT